MGGTVILLVSILCFTFNIRFLVWYRFSRYQNTLVLSLFVASLAVLIISVPGVLLQLLVCQRHCNPIYCRLEGFTSFLCGCVCMLAYSMLSINWYLSLTEYSHRFFSRYSTVLCWLLSVCWTLPPVFDYGTSYVYEGAGFHCSIHWTDQSRPNRLYILCSFIGMYFVPFMILLVVNLVIHRSVRNVYSYHQSSCNHRHTDSSLSSQSRRILVHEVDQRISIRTSSICQAAQQKHLRIQYRVTLGTLYTVIMYLVAWTPYAIIAILQILDVPFIFQYRSVVTLSAFFAKLSVVLSPMVYVSIMKFRLFKRLLLNI